MIRRLFRRRRFSETAAQHLIDTQFEERLAAYRDGYDSGYAQGLEDGLRMVLADARIALGRAA